MRLVDTSAWVEWLADTPTGRRVGRDLPDQRRWLVPTIVQFELAKWLTREVGEDEADRVIAFSSLCVVAPLDTATALSGADLSSRHGLPAADALVYATALVHGADLLTCDRYFEGLPSVLYVAKGRG